MNKQRAATTWLEPGHHSIDRATPRLRGGVWKLDWSIRLPDGRRVDKRSQAPTKGEVRRRAKVAAAELVATSGGTWKSKSLMTDYLDQVSRPAIEQGQLSEHSKRRYLIVLDLLAGNCTKHQHDHSMKGHSIGSGTHFRPLEACLKEIAELHGTESARQTRSVVSKYVLQQMIRDDLIQGNPLSGMSIDLRSPKQATSSRGGQALTTDEYNAVLDHLLELDPAEGLKQPSRGRWSLADRIAKRRNTVDLTLLQATTGLRISEANALTWDLAEVGDDGTLHMNVTASISKTHRSRRVPVLDPQVAQRLLTRQNAAPNPRGYVIGSPADPTTPWDRDNCQKATTTLYKELAEVLGIELLETARTHVWRTTLNSMLLGDVPEVVRAAHFGHDAAVNRTAYTDLTNTSPMVNAARRLRAV